MTLRRRPIRANHRRPGWSQPTRKRPKGVTEISRLRIDLLMPCVLIGNAVDLTVLTEKDKESGKMHGGDYLCHGASTPDRGASEAPPPNLYRPSSRSTRSDF